MRVDELIRELRKFPADVQVGICDHDAGENELSARVVSVRPFDAASCEMVHASRAAASAWATGVGVVIDAG